MKKPITTILGRSAVLLSILLLVIIASYARGDSTGITFATAGVDLKIDSRAFYDGASVPGSTWTLKNLVPTADHFFSFGDIKPGDYGRTIVSLHVTKSPAYLCLDFTHFVSKDNGLTEPEGIVDTNGNTLGELASGTEFFGWLDNGDGIFQPGEKVLFGTTTQSADVVLNNTSYVIGDSKQGGSCGINQARYVGLAWCAGNLVVNTTTGTMTCDGGALGNIAQTDSFTFDVGVRVESSNENQKFLCSTGAPIPPPPPKCENQKSSKSSTGLSKDDKNDKDSNCNKDSGKEDDKSSKDKKDRDDGKENKDDKSSGHNFNVGPVHW